MTLNAMVDHAYQDTTAVLLAFEGLTWCPVWHDKGWYGTAWDGMEWNGIAWHGMVWNGMALHGWHVALGPGSRAIPSFVMQY